MMTDIEQNNSTTINTSVIVDRVLEFLKKEDQGCELPTIVKHLAEQTAIHKKRSSILKYIHVIMTRKHMDDCSEFQDFCDSHSTRFSYSLLNEMRENAENYQTRMDIEKQLHMEEQAYEESSQKLVEMQHFMKHLIKSIELLGQLQDKK